MTDSTTFSIDVFSVFRGKLWLAGWIFGSVPIESLELRSSGLPEGRHFLASYGTVLSEDVQLIHGAAAKNSRLDELIDINPENKKSGIFCNVASEPREAEVRFKWR